MDPSGHDTCRSHAYCGYLIEEVVVWHHDECDICYGLWSSLSSDEVIIFNYLDTRPIVVVVIYVVFYISLLHYSKCSSLPAFSYRERSRQGDSQGVGSWVQKELRRQPLPPGRTPESGSLPWSPSHARSSYASGPTGARTHPQCCGNIRRRTPGP